MTRAVGRERREGRSDCSCTALRRVCSSVSPTGRLCTQLCTGQLIVGWMCVVSCVV